MAESAPAAAPTGSKKKPNRLLVEEATNDDNSVVALNTATMEELCVRPTLSAPPLPRSLARVILCTLLLDSNLFRGDTVILKVRYSLQLAEPPQRARVGARLTTESQRPCLAGQASQGNRLHCPR